MKSDEAVIAVIDALNDLQLPYVLSGSFASNHYAIPRSTQDADFVLELGSSSIGELADRLGAEFRLDRQMSFETITGTYRYIAKLAHGRFKFEFFLLSDDPHDRERFARRRRELLMGRNVYFPAAEDVIISKLRWSQRGRRRKDLDDAQNVIAVQAGRLDWDYVYRWCDQHGTRELLEQVRASIPPID
ncbi:MAG TPA: hypothetical protein VGM03_06230 [Phycisphaerae bacterium]